MASSRKHMYITRNKVRSTTRWVMFKSRMRLHRIPPSSSCHSKWVASSMEKFYNAKCSVRDECYFEHRIQNNAFITIIRPSSIKNYGSLRFPSIVKCQAIKHYWWNFIFGCIIIFVDNLIFMLKYI